MNVLCYNDLDIVVDVLWYLYMYLWMRKDSFREISRNLRASRLLLVCEVGKHGKTSSFIVLIFIVSRNTRSILFFFLRKMSDHTDTCTSIRFSLHKLHHLLLHVCWYLLYVSCSVPLIIVRNYDTSKTVLIKSITSSSSVLLVGGAIFFTQLTCAPLRGILSTPIIFILWRLIPIFLDFLYDRKEEFQATVVSHDTRSDNFLCLFVL